MRRISLSEGNKAEILEELDTLGRDALQNGKEDKARPFAEAMAQIEQGETTVTIGHRRYAVTE